MLKEYPNMRLLKIKEFWDHLDNDLVMNNSFTKLGMATYWRAMDASFKFNVLKRRDYLIRTSFKQLKSIPEGEFGTKKRKFNECSHEKSINQKSFITQQAVNHVNPPTQIRPCDGRHDPMASLFSNIKQLFTQHDRRNNTAGVEDLQMKLFR